MKECPHRFEKANLIQCKLLNEALDGFPIAIPPGLCNECQGCGAPDSERSREVRTSYLERVAKDLVRLPPLGRLVDTWEYSVETIAEWAGTTLSEVAGWPSVEESWRKAQIQAAKGHLGKVNPEYRVEICRSCSEYSQLVGGIGWCRGVPCSRKVQARITPAVLTVEGLKCPWGKF